MADHAFPQALVDVGAAPVAEAARRRDEVCDACSTDAAMGEGDSLAVGQCAS